MFIKQEMGYTVAELTVAMGIMVIVAMLCSPLVMDFYQKTQFKDTVLAIETAISKTRLTALSTGKEATLCPYSPKENCGLDWHNGFGIFQDHVGFTYHHEAIPDSVNLTQQSSKNTEYLTFSPMGFTEQNGHFFITQSRGDCVYAAKVIVRKSGHSHTEESFDCSK